MSDKRSAGLFSLYPGNEGATGSTRSDWLKTELTFALKKKKRPLALTLLAWALKANERVP